MNTDIQIQIQKSELALSKNADATTYLMEAIKIHKGHMNGSVPTSDGSQEELMVLMQKALSSLGEI